MIEQSAARRLPSRLAATRLDEAVMREVEAVLIAGATASGKSALALELAVARGGVIVNADSMQVYRDLRLLTARPTQAEEAAVPHRLFGHVDGSVAHSVGRWLAEMGAALADLRTEHRPALIVGGTGLYFKALLDGLVAVPPVPAEVRARWRSLAETSEPGRLHAMLAAKDPEMAQRLAPTDAQRVVRALEVLDATGLSLAEWQRRPAEPLLQRDRVERIVVAMDREAIRARCDRRLEQMLELGALDEVRQLSSRRLDAALPVMRAIGVRPFLAHLDGSSSLEQALALAKTETRQYVKRQQTWLAKFMGDWQRVTPSAA